MQHLWRPFITGMVALTLALPAGSAQSPFPAELPSVAEGETAELRLYGLPTQVGTVARRTIRDRSGKVARDVFYTSAVAVLGPANEQDLRMQSISVYHYDAAGRVERVEHWQAKSSVPRVEHNHYTPSGELARKWYVDPDGVRRFEIRFEGSHPSTHLYFDDTGSYVTSLRGALARDVDLRHGWGPSSGGMACGITLSRERGRFAEIEVWVNVKNTATKTVSLETLPEPSFELRDTRGIAVPPRGAEPETSREVKKGRPQLYGQVLERGEAGYVYPAYRLADHFDPLPPGKYRLRVRQPVPMREAGLVSNDVTFVVVP